MPDVKFWRGTTQEIKNRPIKDGQLLYDIETGRIWQDVNSERLELNRDRISYNPQELTNEQQLQAKTNIGAGNAATPEMFGATGDGVTDDTAAFEKLAAYCKANSAPLFCQTGKKYKLNHEVLVKGLQEIDIQGRVIGSLRIELDGEDHHALAPHVYVRWADNITIMGANSADIVVQRVKQLTLLCDGTANNTFIGYSKFILGKIDKLIISGIDPNGWVNENWFIGGRFNSIASTGVDGFEFNENKFEKSFCENCVIDLQTGRANHVIDARMEGAQSKITFGPDAYNNVVTTNFAQTTVGCFLTDDIDTYRDAVVISDVTGTNVFHRNEKLNRAKLLTICDSYNPRNLPVFQGKLQVSAYDKFLESDLVAVPNFTFCLIARFAIPGLRFWLSCYDAERNQIIDPKILINTDSVSTDHKGRIGNVSFTTDKYWALVNPALDPRVAYISLTGRNETASEFAWAEFELTAYSEISSLFITALQTDKLTDIGSMVSFHPQSPTPEEQTQARENISAISGKEAVEALCPTFSETAPVVTCQPVGLGYPFKAVKSHLIPQQSGSGDPSPENVRPFVPYERAELTRCGKNLVIGGYKDQKSNGITFTVQPDGGVHAVGHCDTQAYFTFSTLSRHIISQKYGNGVTKEVFVDGFYIKDCMVTTLISGRTLLGLTLGAGDWDRVFYPVMAKSNVAVPYEPYHGETYTAPLPAETYGGEVDWMGKTIQPVTAPIPMETRNGNWLAGNKFSYIDTGAVFKKNAKIARCNKLSFAYNVYGGALKNNTFSIDGAGNVVFKADGVSDSSTFKDFLKGLLIVAEPENSEARTITPSAVPSPIPGVNTLYSVGGDTTVEGYAEPEKHGVSYKPQNLTPEQMEQARMNINAGEKEGDWELIEKVTTDTTAMFLRTEEPDGTKYHFKGLCVTFHLPDSTENKQVGVKSFYDAQLAPISKVYLRFDPKNVGAYTITELNHNQWQVFNSKPAPAPSTASNWECNTKPFNGDVENFPEINKLEVYYNPLPAGTEIEIWAVRA